MRGQLIMLIDNLKILCEACIKILHWTTKELPHIKELVKSVFTKKKHEKETHFDVNATSIEKEKTP